MANASDNRCAGTTIVTGASGFVGGHVMDRLIDSGRSVRGLSRSIPVRRKHADLTDQVDLLDRVGLLHSVRRHAPSEIVHLGARTDFFEREDRVAWTVNTQGTRNLLAAAAEAGRPIRLIFVSSFVVERRAEAAERGSESRLDYVGSKLEGERIVRADAGRSGPWCIVRPATVWGPGQRGPSLGFFRAVSAGRYFHPGRPDPPKRLSYVGNLAFQIERLLDAPADRIAGRTFYLADYDLTTNRKWAEAICRRLEIASPRTLPGPLVRLAAWFGDALRAAGVTDPPMTSRRLANMRKDTSWVPIEELREITGPRLPYTLEQGVACTLESMAAPRGT